MSTIRDNEPEVRSGRRAAATVTVGGDDPIAANYHATPQQITLAWQLHRTAQALPIPDTTSAQHLRENLAAARIALTQPRFDAITALAPEED